MPACCLCVCVLVASSDQALFIQIPFKYSKYLGHFANKIPIFLQIIETWKFEGVGSDVFLGSSHALDFERAGEAELPRYASNRHGVGFDERGTWTLMLSGWHLENS